MKWLLPTPLSEEERQFIEKTAKELDIDSELIALLYRRGIRKEEEMETFLHPSFKDYHDPFLLHDMGRAIERLREALNKDEPILIYGDYDADGMTATSIALEGLESIGANVHYYLPNRFTDGYGPNKEVYKYYIDQGIQLILTVDNGVSGHEAIAYAQERGVDVIVTDHHDLPDELPNAYAIVHPRHPGAQYPFGDLCGAGVALKLVHALTGEFPSDLVDLAAIGTIADLVSLTDENRFIVKSGLAMMNEGHRLGLQILLQQLPRPLEGPMTEQTVAFTIAPRLNALGRLKDPNPAVELLTTFDEERASELAQELEKVNQERMDLVNEASQRAMEMVGQNPKEKILVVYQADFHQGILGIVASRLLEHYQRPVIVLGDDSKGGKIKGSGRSTPSIHLFHLLQKVSDSLLVFGGHAQAAGMTLEKNKLEEFITALEDQMSDRLLEEASQEVDMLLSPDRLTEDFYKNLNRLAPFGSHFPLPLLGLMKTSIHDVKAIGSQKEHLKGKVGPLAFIAFRFGNQEKLLQESEGLNVFGHLGLNYWQGKAQVQLQVKGFERIGKRWVDQRKSKIESSWLHLENTLYVIETTRIKNWLQPKLGNGSFVTSYNELDQVEGQFERVVLLECPLVSFEHRKLSFSMADEIWLIAFRFYHYLERAIPSKEKFASVYRQLKPGQPQAIQDLLDSEQLEMDEDKLRFVLKVFSELNFVILEKDQVTRALHPKAIDLNQSELLQKRIEAAKVERFFAYQPLKTIVSTISIKNEDE
ncbi:single-stranded-DNA-specific exonuclease RecJ [Atopobacter sp. AH10]|uniref:single-stranded-DNA-specific exonuclease RecJ n=1 Tax=Atopobacter sp. AH10 TaxID=2315861 RepID=UPI000EF1C8BE|nr:single-stranded-DNA-specific exonuclease RecJ [Atopobacter sp. AH10]RLK62506.1 single-stranded-DNA-specific exonuclease RecJ [Atopobacter sp. AH10]